MKALTSTWMRTLNSKRNMKRLYNVHHFTRTGQRLDLFPDIPRARSLAIKVATEAVIEVGMIVVIAAIVTVAKVGAEIAVEVVAVAETEVGAEAGNVVVLIITTIRISRVRITTGPTTIVATFFDPITTIIEVDTTTSVVATTITIRTAMGTKIAMDISNATGTRIATVIKIVMTTRIGTVISAMKVPVHDSTTMKTMRTMRTMQLPVKTPKTTTRVVTLATAMVQATVAVMLVTTNTVTTIIIEAATTTGVVTTTVITVFANSTTTTTNTITEDAHRIDTTTIGKTTTIDQGRPQAIAVIDQEKETMSQAKRKSIIVSGTGICHPVAVDDLVVETHETHPRLVKKVGPEVDEVAVDPSLDPSQVKVAVHERADNARHGIEARQKNQTDVEPRTATETRTMKVTMAVITMMMTGMKNQRKDGSERRLRVLRVVTRMFVI